MKLSKRLSESLIGRTSDVRQATAAPDASSRYSKGTMTIQSHDGSADAQWAGVRERAQALRRLLKELYFDFEVAIGPDADGLTDGLLKGPVPIVLVGIRAGEVVVAGAAVAALLHDMKHAGLAARPAMEHAARPSLDARDLLFGGEYHQQAKSLVPNSWDLEDLGRIVELIDAMSTSPLSADMLNGFGPTRVLYARLLAQANELVEPERRVMTGGDVINYLTGPFGTKGYW